MSLKITSPCIELMSKLKTNILHAKKKEYNEKLVKIMSELCEKTGTCDKLKQLKLSVSNYVFEEDEYGTNNMYLNYYLNITVNCGNIFSINMIQHYYMHNIILNMTIISKKDNKTFNIHNINTYVNITYPEHPDFSNTLKAAFSNIYNISCESDKDLFRYFERYVLNIRFFLLYEDSA